MNGSSSSHFDSQTAATCLARAEGGSFGARDAIDSRMPSITDRGDQQQPRQRAARNRSGIGTCATTRVQDHRQARREEQPDRAVAVMSPSEKPSR